MGIEYPFVDHRNVVGVIFFGTKDYLIIPDYSSYYVFLGPNRKPGPRRQRARQSDDGPRPFPELDRRHAQPQAGRLVRGDRGGTSLVDAWPTWPTSLTPPAGRSGSTGSGSVSREMRRPTRRSPAPIGAYVVPKMRFRRSFSAPTLAAFRGRGAV